MIEATTTARAERLLDLLGERELDCLLVTNLVNVRYLTGFTGTNGACIVTPDERLFVTDFRYVEQAQDQVRGFDLVKGERDLLGQLGKLLNGRVGFDDAHVTVRVHDKLREATQDGVELVEAAGLVERLREVKDEDELRAIAAAAELADGVYELLRQRGPRGRTEAELARELEREIRDRGAEPLVPDDRRLGSARRAAARGAARRGDRARLADDRRHGRAAGRLLLGLHAHLRHRRRRRPGRRDLRPGPGRPGGRSGRRARRERPAPTWTPWPATGSSRRGWASASGTGLATAWVSRCTSGPRLAKTAEGELRAGSVVTVEPGVYLPGELGVRIEDLVVVSDDGSDVLTGFPKELIRLD